jgi:ribonucleoside-diphosphate reductase alpha chain
MVVVDIDHPDIEDYIDWKVKEEQKVAALVTGSKIVKQHLKAIMKACVNCDADGQDACFDPAKNPALKREIKDARKAQVPENYIKRVLQFASQGFTDIEFEDLRHRLGFGSLPDGFGPELQQLGLASPTSSCARSRNGEWDLTGARQGDAKTVKARELWERSAMPPGPRPIRASSSHHHQRLAHLPGVRRDPRLQPVLGIHVPGRHGLQPGLAEPAAPSSTRTPSSTLPISSMPCRLWTMVLEISVLMAQFPSKEDRANCPTSTAPWASASPISAAC